MWLKRKGEAAGVVRRKRLDTVMGSEEESKVGGIRWRVRKVGSSGENKHET